MENLRYFTNSFIGEILYKLKNYEDAMDCF